MDKELIKLAKKAGFGEVKGVIGVTYFSNAGPMLEAFAKLIIAAEREECAKAAEKQFEPEVWQRLEKAWLIGYDAGREAEREACALVCEQVTAAWSEVEYNEGCMDCSKAIRARGHGEAA